jgi:hypothetical protein
VRYRISGGQFLGVFLGGIVLVDKGEQSQMNTDAHWICKWDR